jgi:hypothetical protein
MTACDIYNYKRMFKGKIGNYILCIMSFFKTCLSKFPLNWFSKIFSTYCAANGPIGLCVMRNISVSVPLFPQCWAIFVGVLLPPQPTTFKLRVLLFLDVSFYCTVFQTFFVFYLVEQKYEKNVRNFRWTPAFTHCLRLQFNYYLFQ